MALAQKYDLIAQSKKYKDIYRLKLSMEGYEGSVIDRDMPAEKPFRLIRDKEKVICATTLEFGMIAWTDFEFLELYTSNCREWLAELYRDNYHKQLITGWSNWSGYDLLTTDGNIITSAISDGSGYAYTKSDLFAIKKDQSITVTLTATSVSGPLPRTGLLSVGGGSWKSNQIQIVADENVCILTATEDLEDAFITLESGFASEWYTGEVTAYYTPELIFKGFVVAELYQEEYKPAPVTIRFSATDGLGLLKEEDFTLTGRLSQLDILRHCIDKIGLDLGYSIAIGLHEENMDDELTPLAQAYENATLYLGKSCYEVIEHILEKYSATITQHQGMWHITSQPDRKMTRLLYAADGDYEGTADAPGVLTIAAKSADPDAYPVGQPMMLSMEPARKSLRIIQDLHKKGSFLDNHKFEIFDGTDFDGWTTEHIVQQREHDGVKYLYFPGWNFSYHSIWQEKFLDNIIGGAFVFKAKVSAMGIRRPPPGFDKPILNMVVRMSVTFVVGATTWFLAPEGWTTDNSGITLTIEKSAYPFPEWHDISVIMPGLPGASGTLRVSLYRTSWNPPLYYIESSIGMAFTDVMLTQEKFAGYPETLEQVININPAALQKADDLNVMQADLPNVSNNTVIWAAYISLSSGLPTQLWRRIGEEGAIYNLVSHYALVLENNSVRPRMLLEGSLRGRDITFESIFRHVYNSDREFEILSGEWDIYEDKWSLRLLEYFAWSPPAVIAPTVTLVDVILPEGVISGGSTIDAQAKLINTGGTRTMVFIRWELLDSLDVVVQSGGLFSAFMSPVETLYQTIPGIEIPEDPDTYNIRAWLNDYPVVDAVYSDDIVITAEISSVTCNSVADIEDGSPGEYMLVSFNYTNSGSAGYAEFEYAIKLGGEVVLYDSQMGSFEAGTSDNEIPYMNYPMTPGYYTVEVKMVTDETWRASNVFEVI